jgi:hypothetical protein
VGPGEGALAAGADFDAGVFAAAIWFRKIVKTAPFGGRVSPPLVR